MGKEEIPAALQEAGPHGFTIRWVLYVRSCKTIKWGNSKETPFHYIERHSFWKRRPWQVLHQSAHKKDKSPALVAIYKPKKSWFFRPRDFLIKFPGQDASKNIDMKMMDRSIWNGFNARSYEFNMVTAAGHNETFHWVKADWGSHCEEVKLIRKEDEPPVHTGDQRPEREEGFHFSKPYAGWILVRVNGPNRKQAPQVAEGGKKSRVNTLPMGYTDDGQEIVASWANCSGWVATRKIIFQFWGAGASGEMGEEWTRVAALTGSTIWDDEERERQRRRAKAQNNSN